MLKALVALNEGCSVHFLKGTNKNPVCAAALPGPITIPDIYETGNRSVHFINVFYARFCRREKRISRYLSHTKTPIGLINNVHENCSQNTAEIKQFEDYILAVCGYTALLRKIEL